MANLITTQLLMDGPSNVILRVDGFVDTADVSASILIDPATLSAYDTYTGVKATKLRVDRIVSAIESPLAVYLSWDATAAVRFVSLTNATEEFEYERFGGLTNNAGAGVTGKIRLDTQGWSTGAILSFSVLLEMSKQA
jgi:hypothetical protein